MAAIGMVLDMVLLMSEALDFATGSWYGITARVSRGQNTQHVP